MDKETFLKCFVSWGCGIIIGILILVTTGNVCPIEFQNEDNNITEEEYNFLYKMDSKRLVNETGLPHEYTCEQIKVMYMSDSYPEHKRVYECQNYPEANYSWCHTVTNSEGLKDTFVKYYILNCLAQKDAFEVKNE